MWTTNQIAVLVDFERFDEHLGGLLARVVIRERLKVVDADEVRLPPRACARRRDPPSPTRRTAWRTRCAARDLVDVAARDGVVPRVKPVAHLLDPQDVDVRRQRVVDPPPERFGRQRRVHVEMRDLAPAHARRRRSGLSRRARSRARRSRRGRRDRSRPARSARSSGSASRCTAVPAYSIVSLNRGIRHHTLHRTSDGAAVTRRMSHVCRRLPVGAEVQPDGATHFRVWAPAPRR